MLYRLHWLLAGVLLAFNAAGQLPTQKHTANGVTVAVTPGNLERGLKNWDFSANGTQTMTQLLQKSLNTGAIWLSDLIGANKLYESFDRFGFGDSTYSGLGGESTGLVRTNKDSNWYPSDLATNSYGQGIAATEPYPGDAERGKDDGRGKQRLLITGDAHFHCAELPTRSQVTSHAIAIAAGTILNMKAPNPPSSTLRCSR